MRFFVHVIAEWIEVQKDVYDDWKGAKGTYEMEPKVSDASGWIVEKQKKRYGRYVTVVRNGSIEVQLSQNPLGLNIQKMIEGVEPTRVNADKIGWGLDQVFKMFDELPRAGRGVSTIVVPQALGPEDAPEDDIEGRAPTMISDSWVVQKESEKSS